MEGVGEGSTDGSAKRRVVGQRKKLRGSVIGKALELHPDQLARPVLAWPQLDKLSSAWLLAYPGPHSGLPTTVFSEAVCSHLCLPSPACRDRIGQRVGKAVDGWRIRHDMVKAELNRLCVRSKLPATYEVFGLFSHLIPQEGLSRIERGRKRQGMVPDFQLESKSIRGEGE